MNKLTELAAGVHLGGRGRKRQVQEYGDNHGGTTRSRCDLASCSPDRPGRKLVLCPSLLSCDTGWELASGNAVQQIAYTTLSLRPLSRRLFFTLAEY